MAALAEFEVDMIRENVRAGLLYAKARGRRIGCTRLQDATTASRSTIRRRKQAVWKGHSLHSPDHTDRKGDRSG
jgi:DNA invertase Pin-like site-specific DNA recombinase